jgi:arylsulfatase
VGTDQFTIRAAEPVTAGHHTLTAAFQADKQELGSGGTLTISIDGKPVGSGRIGRTIRGWMSHTEGFDVGMDTITPVNGDYTIASSRFSGTLRKLEFKLK